LQDHCKTFADIFNSNTNSLYLQLQRWPVRV